MSKRNETRYNEALDAMREGYIAGRTAEPTEAEIEAAVNEWDRHGYCHRVDTTIVCMCGARLPDEHSYDVHLVRAMLEAVRDGGGGMRYSLDANAYKPIRAHTEDAGIDLCAMEAGIIWPDCGRIIHTGVHLEIPIGYAGLLVSKSGLNVEHGITTTGLIDSGYTGEIIVKAYNHSEKDYTFHAGDKITQLVLIPIATPTLTQCASITGGERGDNGFGSTGR